VSVSAVVLNADTQSLASVLSAAYAACYPPKTKGGIACMCTNDDSELAQQRGEMQWVSRITKALEENSACIPNGLCQLLKPRGRVIVRVLLRLEEETGKIVSMAFIPAAERYQLMHLIDRWVISTLLPIWGSNTRIGTAPRCRMAQSLCCQPLWR